MKKTIPIILLFLVCLSFTITAYAEGENNSWDESDASVGPCFTVTYDGPIGMTAPEETLHFTVSKVNGHTNPGYEMITIPDKAINNEQTTVPIVLPEFKSVGEYQYCITQDAGSYPEYEYDSGQIIFHVLVGFDVSDNITVLATGIGFSDSGKKVSFTNRFGYGTLKISSSVIGTDQDRDKDFEVTILFTVPEGREVLSPISYTVLSSNGTKTAEGSIPANWDGRVKEVTLTLKHGSTATFSSIPAGVLYSVTQETEAGFDVPEISPASGTITAGVSENTSVTNRAVFNLGTGILFRNTGHIIILIVGIIGLTVLLLRGIRRRG